MADRKLYLQFTKTKTKGIIHLYEENAPVTCATLWKALKKPIRVTVFHAMFAGPEIMTGLPAARFPGHLTLEEQGLFAIGYYHQRQAFFTKKTETADTTHPTD